MSSGPKTSRPHCDFRMVPTTRWPGSGHVTVLRDGFTTDGQDPALERRIREEQERTRSHVNLFVGSDNVRDRDGTATPVLANEELSIIPAVSGG